MKTNNIWFTSDTHFMHKNLCLGETTWDVAKNTGQIRDFKDRWQMTAHLIEKINQYVAEDDLLFHLGDWSFGDVDTIKQCRDQIVCKNIVLMLGNHDDHIRENNRSMGVPSQSLFNAVHERLNWKVSNKGRRIIMDHYAMRTWHHSHKGSFQLHGHSHSSLEQHTNQHEVNKFYNQFRTMDVGVDNAFRIFGEYKPFSLDWILNTLNARPSLTVDHHDPDSFR